MSVVALASARHSPGVTTTALVAASAWPRPVLVVEADPAGGDLICYFRLYGEPNLLTLAAVGRTTVSAADVWANTQELTGASLARVVVAPVDAKQVRAAVGALTRGGLSEALADLAEADVLIDVGRLDAESPAFELFAAADVRVMVTKPTLNQVDHLGTRMAWLKAEGLSDVRLVIVGESPWKPAEVARSVGTGVVAAVLPDDPRGAVWLTGEDRQGRGFGRSALWRAAAGLVEGLAVSAAPGQSADSGRLPMPAAVAPEPWG